MMLTRIKSIHTAPHPKHTLIRPLPERNTHPTTPKTSQSSLCVRQKPRGEGWRPSSTLSPTPPPVPPPGRGGRVDQDGCGGQYRIDSLHPIINYILNPYSCHQHSPGRQLDILCVKINPKFFITVANYFSMNQTHCDTHPKP